MDRLIAAVAIEHDIPLLHNDGDFDPDIHVSAMHPPEKRASLRRITSPSYRLANCMLAGQS